MDPTTKIILAMATTLMVLITIVVIVGLLQETLSTTGTATVLVGAFTGLMSGFYLRRKDHNE